MFWERALNLNEIPARINRSPFFLAVGFVCLFFFLICQARTALILLNIYILKYVRVGCYLFMWLRLWRLPLGSPPNWKVAQRCLAECDLHKTNFGVVLPLCDAIQSVYDLQMKGKPRSSSWCRPTVRWQTLPDRQTDRRLGRISQLRSCSRRETFLRAIIQTWLERYIDLYENQGTDTSAKHSSCATFSFSIKCQTLFMLHLRFSTEFNKLQTKIVHLTPG